MSTHAGVYVKDKDYAWLPSTVISSDGDVAKVSVSVPSSSGGEDTIVQREVKLSDYEANALPLQNVDESGNLLELADMRDLPSLHEAAILYNLKARHEVTKPYTRVGDIIIAMNPFQWLNHLYSEETREVYVNKIIWKVGGSGDPREGLEPHVYETSALAYRGLAVDGIHQSILVSGESGAGKTETVKIVMSHLAAVHSERVAPTGGEEGKSEDAPHDPNSDIIVKKVVESNTLLEAFGNAKTVRNNNSSRFGKYIQLQFDVEDQTSAAFAGKTVPSCILAGSVNETYLLEKTRVVGHESNERTYHIFYQLTAAPEDIKTEIWDGLAGTDSTSFSYVGNSEPLLIDGLNDAEKFQETMNSLEAVGIKGDKFHTLMRAICTVMQLGNLTFAVDPSNDDASIISSEDEMVKLADLMGVETSDIQKALTTKTVKVGRENFTKPQTLGEAASSRDAFAKEIYQQSFDWLVRQLNEATSAELNYEDVAQVEEFGHIGLLDIFGFESFEENRFEQMCINYTNEKLQQMYTLDTFRSVQEEYEHEGIQLEEITFDDNEEVLNLVEGRVGIIAVLNEEGVRPKGSDASFVSKLTSVSGDTSVLIHGRLYRPTEFAVVHYAGQVKYDATDFIKKNTDSIPNDLLECACKSSNELISSELKAAAESAAEKKTARGRGKTKKLTVATKFRAQLNALMNSIGQTRTRYIRCIKPNPEKLPNRMNLLSSAEQLRCAGVVAAVTISRAAFPNRLLHDVVVDRFGFLSSGEGFDDLEEKKDETGDDSGLRSMLERLMAELLHDRLTISEEGQERVSYACGKTRIYFRSGILEHLESLRTAAFSSHAIVLQRVVRGFVARSKFLKFKAAVIKVQAVVRGFLLRSLFLRKVKAAIAIGCLVRVLSAKRLVKELRENRASRLIQTRWRIYQATAMLSKHKKAAIVIQKCARRMKWKILYCTMLQKSREKKRMSMRVSSIKNSMTRLSVRDTGALLALQKEFEEGEESPESLASIEEENEVFNESTELMEKLHNDLEIAQKENDTLQKSLEEQKELNKGLAEKQAIAEAAQQAISKENKKLIEKTEQQEKDLMEAKKEANAATRKFQEELKEKDATHEAEMALLRKELEKYMDKAARADEPSPSPKDKRQQSFKRAKVQDDDKGVGRFNVSPSAMDEESAYLATYGKRAAKQRKKLRKNVTKLFSGGTKGSF